MMNSNYWKGLRLWLQGLLLLALRWAQLRTGFDPETGLSRSSVPGTVLAVLILLLIVVEAVLCFRLPRGKRSYLNCMDPIAKNALIPIAAGSVLLCGGAIGDHRFGVLSILAAGAGAGAMVCLINFVRLLRKDGKPSVLLLLLPMVFSVLFLLTVYIPEESNPVLARYYLPVLAAAMAACAFYQLAGLVCREGKLGWFVFFGDLTVVLCLASIADCSGDWGRMFVFFGFALVLTQFLMVRRSEPLPEPEPKESDGKTEKA